MQAVLLSLTLTLWMREGFAQDATNATEQLGEGAEEFKLEYHMSKSALSLALLAVCLFTGVILAKVTDLCHDQLRVHDDSSDISDHTRALLRRKYEFLSRWSRLLKKKKSDRERGVARDRSSELARAYGRRWHFLASAKRHRSNAIVSRAGAEQRLSANRGAAQLCHVSQVLSQSASDLGNAGLGMASVGQDPGSVCSVCMSTDETSTPSALALQTARTPPSLLTDFDLTPALPRTNNRIDTPSRGRRQSQSGAELDKIDFKSEGFLKEESNDRDEVATKDLSAQAQEIAVETVSKELFAPHSSLITATRYLQSDFVAIEFIPPGTTSNNSSSGIASCTKNAWTEARPTQQAE